ncbi:MAG: hypothetical protein K5793_00420 [Nitrosarchaeum sp.]|nr:hypothetical protein [Nitrosarchaeum sp.]MCV0399199.1 hypothetical protein [Nitrosarchaeum sp.]
MVEYTNIIVGITIIIIGIVIAFIGRYYSKKIGIIHVVIYFMAAFVIFGGVSILFLYDKASIF